MENRYLYENINDGHRYEITINTGKEVFGAMICGIDPKGSWIKVQRDETRNKLFINTSHIVSIKNLE